MEFRQPNRFKPVEVYGGNGAAFRCPIGVFDSGVGGLTVLRQLRQALPQESILYFGDTANLPYGTKSADEILDLVRAILRWMVDYPVKMVIMACNTSSALALETVQTEFEIPIFGVIFPAARAAALHGQRIGVLATPATAHSHAYRDAIHSINPDAQVWEIGCPEFVPLIEADQIFHPETKIVVQRYLNLLVEQQIDTLVYGCTHYPHLSPLIGPCLPSTVQIVDPAIALSKAVAQELNLLGHQHEDATVSLESINEFFVSDRPERFNNLASRLLGYDISVKLVAPGNPEPSSRTVSTQSR